MDRYAAFLMSLISSYLFMLFVECYWKILGRRCRFSCCIDMVMGLSKSMLYSLTSTMSIFLFISILDSSRAHEPYQTVITFLEQFVRELPIWDFIISCQLKVILHNVYDFSVFVLVKLITLHILHSILVCYITGSLHDITVQLK